MIIGLFLESSNLTNTVDSDRLLDMDMVDQALARFGLNANEVKVYREALKSEETSPYPLSKATGIPRSTVYEIIMTLSLKGLVELDRSDGFTKQQTKIRAKNPSQLRKIIWKKRDDLTALESDVVNILPMLKSDYHKEKAHADFMFYPGIAGAKNVLSGEKENRVDVPMYSWDYQIPMDAFGPEFMNHDVDVTIKRNEQTHGPNKELIPLNAWSKHVVSYQYQRNPDYIHSTEFRYIDSPIWELKQRISIQGSHIRIICVEDEENWGIVIHSKSLATSLISLFNLMWMTATPITDDVVKSWGENEFYKKQQEKK